MDYALLKEFQILYDLLKIYFSQVHGLFPQAGQSDIFLPLFYHIIMC